MIPPNGAARRSPQGASALGRPGGAGVFPPNGAARRSPQGASALGRPGGAHSMVSSIACSGRSSTEKPRFQFSIPTWTERTVAHAKPNAQTP